MAKIRSMLNCPNCDEDIAADGPVVTCPGCKYPLGPRSEGYQYPEFITEFFIKANNEEWLRETILNMPFEKAKFLLTDAQEVLRLATGKKCSQQDIRTLAEIAIRVGNMGKAIIDLQEAGCRHVPGLYINNIKETQNVELSQEAAGGERTPTSPSNVTPAFFSTSDGGRDTH